MTVQHDYGRQVPRSHSHLPTPDVCKSRPALFPLVQVNRRYEEDLSDPNMVVGQVHVYFGKRFASPASQQPFALVYIRTVDKTDIGAPLAPDRRGRCMLEALDIISAVDFDVSGVNGPRPRQIYHRDSGV